MAEPSHIYPRSVLEQLTGDFSASSGGKSQLWVPEPGCGLKIMDLRPRAAAMANRTGGECCRNFGIVVDIVASECLIARLHAKVDCVTLFEYTFLIMGSYDNFIYGCFVCPFISFLP